MLENLGIVLLEAWDAPGQDLERAVALARRRLGGVTLLEWVARRVTDAELLDRTIVLLPGDEYGPAGSLASLVPPDVPVYFAGNAAPLGRLAQTLATFPAQGVVTVGLSSRLVDPHHIDQLIIAARDQAAAEFIGFRSAEGVSSDLPRWCRTDALARLAMLMSQKNELVCPNADDLAKFNQHWISLAAREEMYSTQSATTDDDWELTETIFESMGPDSFDNLWVADRAQAVPAPTAVLQRRQPVREVLDLN